MEYLFSVNLKEDNVIIKLNIKDNWFKDKKITGYISDDITNVMYYFGYEKVPNKLYFIRKNYGKTKYDIIKELNKCPLLEYSNSFNNCAFTYVFGYHRYENNFRLIVTPKIEWTITGRSSTEEVSDYICLFLIGLGFKQESENVFIINEEPDIWRPKLRKLEYLEFNLSFDYHTA